MAPTEKALTNEEQGQAYAYPSRGGTIYYVADEHRHQVEEAVARLDTKHAGVTKRELFAAMAMQAYLSNPATWEIGTREQLCKAAVEHADALLAALKDLTP